MIFYLLLLSPVIAIVLAWRTFFRRWLLGLFVWAFYGVAPLLIAWAGLGLAPYLGCIPSGGLVFECPRAAWQGEFITTMVFSHWLAIATVPVALLGIASILFSLLARRWR